MGCNLHCVEEDASTPLKTANSRRRLLEGPKTEVTEKRRRVHQLYVQGWSRSMWSVDVPVNLLQSLAQTRLAAITCILVGLLKNRQPDMLQLQKTGQILGSHLGISLSPLHCHLVDTGTYEARCRDGSLEPPRGRPVTTCEHCAHRLLAQQRLTRLYGLVRRRCMAPCGGSVGPSKPSDARTSAWAHVAAAAAVHQNSHCSLPLPSGTKAGVHGNSPRINRMPNGCLRIMGELPASLLSSA